MRVGKARELLPEDSRFAGSEGLGIEATIDFDFSKRCSLTGDGVGTAFAELCRLMLGFGEDGLEWLGEGDDVGGDMDDCGGNNEFGSDEGPGADWGRAFLTTSLYKGGAGSLIGEEKGTGTGCGE